MHGPHDWNGDAFRCQNIDLACDLRFVISWVVGNFIGLQIFGHAPVQQDASAALIKSWRECDISKPQHQPDQASVHREPPLSAQSPKNVRNAERRPGAGRSRIRAGGIMILRLQWKVVIASVHCVVSTRGRGNWRSYVSRNSAMLSSSSRGLSYPSADFLGSREATYIICLC